jgi:hypothetical protein
MSLKEVYIFEIILRKIYMFEFFLKEICDKILLDFPLLISSSSVFCIGKVLDRCSSRITTQEMACKLPWVELIVDKIEKIHQVYYKMCIKIKGKKTHLVPKMDFCGSMQGKGKLG